MIAVNITMVTSVSAEKDQMPENVRPIKGNDEKSSQRPTGQIIHNLLFSAWANPHLPSFSLTRNSKRSKILPEDRK